MLRIYSCIAHEHDLMLVLVAGVICMLASFTALAAFEHALHNTLHRRIFVLVAALVAGLGIWSTHFIAMLAYKPGFPIPYFPITYDVPRTLLSVVVAVVLSGIGFVIALDRRRVMALLGGGVIGAGVAVMHYIGMSALQLPGLIVWDRTLVATSVLLGISLAATAICFHRCKPRNVPWAAGILLTIAICSLHFIGMSAATVFPLDVASAATQSVDNNSLATMVIAATLLIFAIGIGLMLLDRQYFRHQLAQAQRQVALTDEIERSATELKQQVEISGAALDNMAQGLSMFDANDRLVIHNLRFAELYGFPERVIAAGAPFSQIRNHLVAAGLVSQQFRAEVARENSGEVLIRDHEARLLCGRILEIKVRPLPAGGWVATHEDVTEVRHANEQIAYLAAHDTLTGLPNRVAFTANLNVAAREETGFAVHMIDLDRFKEVNDTLGHPVGDKVLMGTAARLRELVREGDVVTRLGGDEFAVIQRDVTDRGAPAALASRIVESLAEPFEFEGHTIVIGASVGFSLAPEDGCNGEELLKMSDLALYCAKEEGRGTYRRFERGMDSRLCERRQLESDLRAAIHEGRFEVYYQPLLDMTSGTISSFEALVRWHHPTRGLVQPSDFIAAAEESGLIVPIGEWVLRQACRDAVRWPSEVGVAVNLSPVQFRHGDLIAMTISALTAAGLDPKRLELEITESVLLHDEVGLQSTLSRLTALGVTISMDDFGTGYSCLSYLRSFPFNKIKIDRSFVSDIASTADALSIVQATIQLSQKLGMDVTAEGVETAEQMQILAAEGCTHAQGFHVGRPVPVADVPALLTLYNSNGKIRAAGGRA